MNVDMRYMYSERTHILSTQSAHTVLRMRLMASGNWIV